MTAAPLDPADLELARTIIDDHGDAEPPCCEQYVLASALVRMAADLAAAQAEATALKAMLEADVARLGGARDRVEALAHRSGVMRVQVSPHQIIEALAGEGA